jgi:hypothetical protein
MRYLVAHAPADGQAWLVHALKENTLWASWNIQGVSGLFNAAACLEDSVCFEPYVKSMVGAQRLERKWLETSFRKSNGPGVAKVGAEESGP